MSSVDVIVPCYQYGHFLEECVQSVLSQTGVEVRVLVIDDASRDSSREVGEALARQETRVQYVRHAWNRGHIRTFNEGLDWAAAKYTVLLSADDLLLPGSLSRAVSLMDAHPEVGFTFGSVECLYPDSSRKTVVPSPMRARREDRAVLDGRRFIELSGATNIVATPTVVVRTDLQKQLGGYRPELPHAGDLEMWLRFASRSAVGFVRASQAVYRRHETNMSNGYALKGMLPDVRQRRLALELFFENCGPAMECAPAWRRKFGRQLAKDTVGLASGALNCGEDQISSELADLALEICPTIKWTWVWTKFALKQQSRSAVKHLQEVMELGGRGGRVFGPRLPVAAPGFHRRNAPGIR